MADKVRLGLSPGVMTFLARRCSVGRVHDGHINGREYHYCHPVDDLRLWVVKRSSLRRA
jgi:hypothetical protein